MKNIHNIRLSLKCVYSSLICLTANGVSTVLVEEEKKIKLLRFKKKIIIKPKASSNNVNQAK